MFNIRKIGLTALALGLVATPVMAETNTNVTGKINPDMQVETETTANYDFGVYDQNDDGVISALEYTDSADENLTLDLFAEYDADTSGTLTEEEFETLARDENVVKSQTKMETELN